MYNDSEKNIEYKGFVIEHFPIQYEIHGEKFENDGYIILSKYKLGEGLFLPLYCELPNGEVSNFKTLEEAKAWIDNYGNNYEIVIKHGDEIHAVPKEKFEIEDSLKKDKYWVNCELRPEKAEILKKYLRDCGIVFEPSQAGDFVHFEMLISEGQEKPLKIVVDNLLK